MLRDMPDSRPPGAPVTRPIYQTSTFVAPHGEQGAAVAGAVHPERFYTRYGSPNTTAVEERVAALEGGEAALAVASGMAAVTSAVLAHVRAGDHVVAQSAHYTGTLSFLDDWLPRFGVEVTRVDQAEPDAVAAALRPATRVVYLETPTNPTMALTDLRAVAALAADHGATSVCDNTFATPYNQRPLELGVDVVVHSATKYLNGHSDVTAGVVVADAETVGAVWEYARVHGPVLHPMEAWLLERGLKTFDHRMRGHNANALVLARALEAHEDVAAVHYPGLASHPQHELARVQMPGGFGGMLSFEVTGTDADERYETAQKVVAGVERCVTAVSLGGTETLLTHPASLVFAHQPPQLLERAGVSPGLLRISVGLEGPEELVADLDRALRQGQRGT